MKFIKKCLKKVWSYPVIRAVTIALFICIDGIAIAKLGSIKGQIIGFFVGLPGFMMLYDYCDKVVKSEKENELD